MRIVAKGPIFVTLLNHRGTLKYAYRVDHGAFFGELFKGKGYPEFLVKDQSRDGVRLYVQDARRERMTQQSPGGDARSLSGKSRMRKIVSLLESTLLSISFRADLETKTDYQTQNGGFSVSLRIPRDIPRIR
jgi:hypothetical protein